MTSTQLVYCLICEANVAFHKGWDQHIQGGNHQRKVDGAGVGVAFQPAKTTATATACDLCEDVLPNRFWNEHLGTRNHKIQEQHIRYMTAVEQSETDKNGVVVEGSFDFEFIDPPAAQLGRELTATIKASQPSSKIVLLEAKLASAQEKSSGGVSPFSVQITGGPIRDVNNHPLTLKIGFKQPYVGRYQDRLELLFVDKQSKKRFIITRLLKAIVGNKYEHEALQPKTPHTYILRSTFKRSAIVEVVEGIKSPATSAIRYVRRLPKAYIPTDLEKVLSNKDSVSRIIDKVKNAFMPQGLNIKSHGQHFKNLLWIEEICVEQNLQRYDMTSTLKKQKEFYYLTIPGLAEKRPSVLVGDSILVQERGGIAGRWFDGRVHIVRETEVALRFHGSFRDYAPDRLFHVRFRLNRIPIQRQHQALDAVFTDDRILFPLVRHLPSSGPPSAPRLQLYNTLISSNECQLQAVVSVVAQRPGSLPFVIFGPPGTGKTITVIECIKQLLDKDPKAKVLACAPSNSAADLIAFRLRGHLNPNELFRFYAPSRFRDQVLDDLRPYTFTEAGGHFSVPSMDRLEDFKVIVSTTISASVFSGIGMARGHFSHVFIDEAGQATESETFVSIKMLADSKTNVILSGDPKQLGPVIRSSIARGLGLEKSYLERLMGREAYKIQTGHSRLGSVVKLIKNFRSHEAILKFPNEKFYRGDLVSCGDPAIINRFLNSPCLPSRKFPVVFHAVSGKDEREASSPSFFNIEEILQVKYYVQKLKRDRNFIIADKDIGIIAPYHAQCLKLRKALKDVASDIKIGSVEEFQGQERKVIIISTVRSSKDLVKFDLHFTLGFVASPRRFNVAVTRAQAMLIIVGDPQLLSLDPLWRGFLNYVYINGGWTGPDITWDPKAKVDETGGYYKKASDTAQFDMVEFTRRMEDITLDEADE